MVGTPGSSSFALGLTRHGPTLWTSHWSAGSEDPTHARHRLAADEAAWLEEPRAFCVELLEGVVREDEGARFLGDAQDEPVTPADCSSWRCHQFAVFDGLLECWHLCRVNPMAECGIDHNNDLGRGKSRVFAEKRVDRFVQLRQAWSGAALGGEVRAVDDDLTSRW